MPFLFTNMHPHNKIEPIDERCNMAKTKRNKVNKKKTGPKRPQKHFGSQDIAAMQAFSASLKASIAHDDDVYNHYRETGYKELAAEMAAFGIMMDETEVMEEYRHSFSSDALVKKYEAKYENELSQINETELIDQSCIRYYVDKVIKSHFTQTIPADPEMIMNGMIFFDQLEEDAKPNQYVQILLALNEMASKQTSKSLEEIFGKLYFDCEYILEACLESIIQSERYDQIVGNDIAYQLELLMSHFMLQNEETLRTLAQQVRSIA